MRDSVSPTQRRRILFPTGTVGRHARCAVVRRTGSWSVDSRRDTQHERSCHDEYGRCDAGTRWRPICACVERKAFYCLSYTTTTSSFRFPGIVHLYEFNAVKGERAYRSGSADMNLVSCTTVTIIVSITCVGRFCNHIRRCRSESSRCFRVVHRQCFCRRVCVPQPLPVMLINLPHCQCPYSTTHTQWHHKLENHDG